MRTLIAALALAAAAAWLCRPAQARATPPALTPADRMGLRWRLLMMSSGRG